MSVGGVNVYAFEVDSPTNIVFSGLFELIHIISDDVHDYEPTDTCIVMLLLIRVLSTEPEFYQVQPKQYLNE